jgi:hypothetical protein
VTPDDGPLPPPLPVRVRPATGETTASYIRRLARANHLRPSLLQVYVRNPDVPTGAIRMRRLVAVSGSTPDALFFALTGLPPAAEPPRRPFPWESRAERRARQLDIIRYQAARGMSIREISGRYRLRRRMVRLELAEPHRRHAPPAGLATGPIRHVLDELAGQARTFWEIWTTVTDEHDSDASYMTVRDYIRSSRLARQLGPPPAEDEHAHESNGHARALRPRSPAGTAITVHDTRLRRG